MSSRTNFIILHKTKYKENSLIIHGYSMEIGRCGFIIRKGGKTGAVSQLHPLGIIEAELREDVKRELREIRDFKTLYPLSSIRDSITKSTIALFISELIYRLIQEFGPGSDFFDFLVKSTLLLEDIDDGYQNFHLWFIVELSKKMGYSPIGNYEESSLFEIASASFVNSRETQFNHFSEESSRLLATILNNREESIYTIRITGKQRRLFIKEMLEFLSYHSGSNMHLYSLDVLQEVFE